VDTGPEKCPMDGLSMLKVCEENSQKNLCDKSADVDSGDRRRDIVSVAVVVAIVTAA